MLRAAESWSTQQLAEFSALVASFSDRQSAARGAIERAAEALEAEVAALVGEDGVEACLGFPLGAAPEQELIDVAGERSKRIEIEGLGSCAAAAVAAGSGRLVVARFGEARFSQEESDLLRGMGRVLALTLRNIELFDDERRLRERSESQAAENAKLLASLRERQALLERLANLQRSIVRRTDLREVLDSIVDGARELMGEEIVALRLVDADDPERTVMVSSRGLSPKVLDAVRRMPIGTGCSGRAIAEERMVVMEDYPNAPGAIADYAEEDITASMAAPVYESGAAAGALVVSSRRPRRTFSQVEREMLTSFAEHASLALNDARAVEAAMQQAFHDSLTGLPNRARFLDCLEAAVRDHRRATVAVLFADLDGFKTVNDSLGHAAGDELLVAVARRLTRCVRPSDTAARFGGDEFAILLERIHGPADAIQAARRILDALDAPFEIRGREVFVDASIGIATGRGEPDHLLRNADLAMYKAKSRGKGRHELFEPGMHAEMVERMELEGDLKRAVERSELVLHYQPILNLRTGEVVGAEALVRWEHPRRGLVMPADFLGIAEETGQILSIGRMVMAEACRQGALWRARYPGYTDFAIAVNISGIQLQQQELVEEVRTALRSSGLDPASLVLEITETVLMDDTEVNVDRLRELKGLGVRIAVDDFGTGYSSLQYLQRFPIDILKIAKSFVDGLGSSAEEPAVARAIIDLGESLDLAVVAEGIELDEQPPRLMELGCEIGQGFLFARPLRAEDMDSLMLERGLFATGREGEAANPSLGPLTESG